MTEIWNRPGRWRISSAERDLTDDGRVKFPVGTTAEDGDCRTNLFNRLYVLYFYSNKFNNTPTYTPVAIEKIVGRMADLLFIGLFEIVDIQHLSGTRQPWQTD
jgi:hypothetical protein